MSILNVINSISKTLRLELRFGKGPGVLQSLTRNSLFTASFFFCYSEDCFFLSHIGLNLFVLAEISTLLCAVLSKLEHSYR